jgi:hypothetical protein
MSTPVRRDLGRSDFHVTDSTSKSSQGRREFGVTDYMTHPRVACNSVVTYLLPTAL